MMRIELPPATEPRFEGARQVVARLRSAGHNAWIVGGAVRDLVMGRLPLEYDVATSAQPSEIQRLFRRTIPVGIQFGVVRVRFKKHEYEVATLRAENGYSDGRRPDSVRFTDLHEDVRRRDFTMNGLVLDPETGEVTDLVGGLEDIGAHLIRAIGEPSERFSEDHLRPLRAVRFAAQTGFEIEAKTLEAIRSCAYLVSTVSLERVHDELRKILLSQSPGKGLRLMMETGLLRFILPELEEVDVTAQVLDRLTGSDLHTMWTALTWSLNPTGAFAALSRLKLSKRDQKFVSAAIEVGCDIEKLPLGNMAAEKRILRKEEAPVGLAVVSARRETLKLDMSCVEYAQRRLQEWSIKDLFPPRLLNGLDAIALGLPRGPVISAALTALEDEQLCDNIKTREEAVCFLKKWASLSSSRYKK